MSKMQLRSGKVFSVPCVKDLCFSAEWPSVSEARALSISTNDQREFRIFCYKLLHENNGTNRYTNRLYSLALVESFYRCGPQVLQMYFPVMKVMYEKLRDVYSPVQRPADMKVYLSQFLDLMIRVAPAGEVDALMKERKIR